jgi:hypothetical protein
MDIALAAVIFIVAFFVIYGIITSKTSSDISSLHQEAERISKEATSQESSLGIVDGEALNETKIQELVEENYYDIKRKIRVEGEFCIYFEDEKGNLIIIQNVSGENITGIGSPDINISGVACR